ncbi:MAG: lysostaphin resistance A-like protein [Candidatus Limnocylindria bacterium]
MTITSRRGFDPFRRQTTAALAVYLALLSLAELAVIYLSPVLVFPLHGGLIALVAIYVALHSDAERHDPTHVALFMVLVLGPLIRIISLTLPLGQIDPAYRYLFAGVPMAVAAFVAVRATGLRWRDVGMRWTAWHWQVAVILAAIPIGFIEFAVLRPEPIGPPAWTPGGILPALSLGFFTGFPEELIFRGVMQTVTRPFFGRWNWIYVAAIFAVLHIGYMSYIDVVFVFGAGLLFGWVFERTRSIIGVSISHGLANVVLFFVAPHLIDLEGVPLLGPQLQYSVGVASVIGIAVAGYFISSSVLAESRRRRRAASRGSRTTPSANL